MKNNKLPVIVYNIRMKIPFKLLIYLQKTYIFAVFYVKIIPNNHLFYVRVMSSKIAFIVKPELVKTRVRYLVIQNCIVVL